ncbi:hypothetical protein N7491_000941 [Penicillium cf. griseofulvum]|nr:hypothetical protein N7491_000941 [Penicillium cf. griseofulvum]
MGGDQAVKLSDHIAAKFGLGVCASEAAMQEFAYNTVDRNIVRIPKVYRYLESKKRDPHGYIFIEYIPGQNLQDIDLEERKDILPRIASIITHLGQIKSAIPGPVTGGEPLGYIWGDYGARTAFKSIEDMNVYMNSRLQHLSANIDLTPHLLEFMKKQEHTPEEEEACEAALFESVYGKAWKSIIAKIRGPSSLNTGTSHTVAPQLKGHEETTQPDARKGEDILGISRIGAPQTEDNENTVQSDEGKSENIIDTCNIRVLQPEGDQNTVQSDAGKVEDIIDTSHIGVHERDWSVHTEQSNARKDEDLSEHDVKQIA